MTYVPPQLTDVYAALRKGEQQTAPVRELLSWFGARRRGVYIIQAIRAALDSLDLRTVPDFQSVYIDEVVRFATVEEPMAIDLPILGEIDTEPPSEGIPAVEDVVVQAFVSGAIDDPTFRVRQLKSANRTPISVTPDADLKLATTLMMINDFSQLPLMQNERDVRGVISWASIGRRIALGKEHSTVKQCMETTIPEVPAHISVLSSIELVVAHGFVLVKQPDRRISGIVTTADLSLEFKELAEPFLLVGEIENSLRRLINNQFLPEQLSAAVDPNQEKKITSVADLTFGDYVFLLQNPANWGQLKLTVDRAAFVQRLDRVRELRNEVMHFNPDPFEPEELETLRSFVVFLRELVPALA